LRNPIRDGIASEIRTLRHTLGSLDQSLRRLAPLLSGAVSKNGAPKIRGRSRPRLSNKARASLVLQGRYMGYMRQLKPRQKTQVRNIKATKGVSAAIARARDLASGH
jgi:hypothetical protein